MNQGTSTCLPTFMLQEHQRVSQEFSDAMRGIQLRNFWGDFTSSQVWKFGSLEGGGGNVKQIDED